MPELPEVETIKRDLAKLLAGKKIFNISTNTPKQIRPSLKTVKKNIIGKKIKGVKRRAKLLLIFLEDNLVLGVHLKMTGQLFFKKNTEPKNKHQRAVITLSEGKELRFNDLRKFGYLQLIKGKKELDSTLEKYGPEPFLDLDFVYFKKLLTSTSRAIKIVLMDQSKISGIGNIYANDALFLARVNPAKPANKITAGKAKKLYNSIHQVLKAGIRFRGASDQSYLDALGQKGSYQDHFLTYKRAGEKCFNCGAKIKRIKLGGRGTFYCPICQK
ncbi:bifunctional DNA-formamidopyrimidine glycosylase/DNA-(apurinic or apyrimidinic site) lyase [Candidatus Shapirobacteria bacterium]|nr:bifunctional DNA-formamidopyrimidine glycosylase/DNA-(apurinic or apyrimidinic site) lyase [Candidatus Shapirobacteria bacterium]